jgi:uncharacterized damage-inducible protein DinB
MPSASAGPTASSASGYNSAGDSRAASSVCFRMNRSISLLKDTQRSVAQALATLSGHALDLLFVQDDAVHERISGAEGPIGLTVRCEYLIEEPGLSDSIVGHANRPNTMRARVSAVGVRSRIAQVWPPLGMESFTAVTGDQEMPYDFLIDTYDSERIKLVSVWSEFTDYDLPVRPRPDDSRGRSVHEQMVHQCVSEDFWFRGMLGIDVNAPPLPDQELRLEFIKRYAEDSGKRLAVLREKRDQWWEEETNFFDVRRARAWVMMRRLMHTSHHRGQLMAMLRMIGRDVHSNYGPTADTGGLMADHAPTIYAYSGLDALLTGEAAGGAKTPLPGALGKPVTERSAAAH